MEEIKKPSLYIAMPCYDSVKIQTMVSMCKLVADLTRAGIKVDINTLKSPYISYARNILTAQFMASDKDYLLFIDADVEFEPECALRMVVAQKDIVCTPYRVKTEAIKYTTTVPDNDNVKVLPGGLVEITEVLQV
jgi:glycosyltransferase involved in cell wall biosynthesis